MSHAPRIIKCDYGAVSYLSFVYTRVLQVSRLLLDLWFSAFSVATSVWVFCFTTQEYPCGSHLVHSLVWEVSCLGGNQFPSPPNSQAIGREILESFSQQQSSSGILALRWVPAPLHGGPQLPLQPLSSTSDSTSPAACFACLTLPLDHYLLVFSLFLAPEDFAFLS